ncbi:FIST N-terminal domain-containing protein [Synechococcus sp. PCC 7336]|uniref:FIST signal transduction protein n=1 Tax=Synechococcus sp. PCC 7336 TaxID=195250 RepID=UPI00034CB482|nr:FIST N-terminal domain-containing protein [Synechococcus sp. PCC 7336]
MQWANALSTQPSLEAALTEVVETALSQLGPVEESAAVDLALIFVSAAFASEYPRIVPLLQTLLPARVLVGCSGGGIVGGGAEIEDMPAVSLSLAMLPNVEIFPFHLEADDLPDLDAPPHQWEQTLGVSQRSQPQFVVLADGFSSKISELLQGLDFAFPSSTKVGGLASGGRRPEGNALFLNDKLYRTGTVGVALSGNIAVDAVVAQGCRPIGEAMTISQAERNVVLGLNEQQPLKALQEMVKQLSDEDRDLVRNSLFAGMVMDEFKEHPEPGDFLIRNIIGIDPRTGAIAVGDRLRSGQRLQFHLRDARTSDEDLRYVLRRYCQERNRQERAATPDGALMFSCLGRGEYLYGKSNHDTQVFENALGEVSMGGFFCNGEIGPVRGTTFLHGYTSVFALFHPRDEIGID